MTPWLTPVFLVRIASIPLAALDEIRFEQVHEALDRCEEIRRAQAPLGERICDALHEEVPRVAPEDRRTLLRIKRDTFNGRSPDAADLERARPWLSPGERSLLDLWTTEQGRWEEARREVDVSLSRELREKRAALQRLCSDPHLNRGIQLSSLQAYQSLERYRAMPPTAGSLRKRDRHIELTALSYLARMATKPTPFGDFTATGFGEWADDGCGIKCSGLDTARSSRVRLSRSFLLAIERKLAEHPTIRTRLYCSLNNTLRRTEQGFEFFSRGLDGTRESFGGEAFGRLPAKPALEEIVALLGASGALRYDALVTALAGRFASVQKAQLSSYVDQLINHRVLSLDARIPDQTEDYLGALTRELEAHPGSECATVLGLLRELAQHERALPTTCVEERPAIMGAIESVFEALAQHLDLPAIHRGNARTFLYEDVTLPDLRVTLDRRTWAPHVSDLALWQRVLPLFDDLRIEKLILRRFYDRAFPDTVEPVPLLEVYRAYRAFGASERKSLWDEALSLSSPDPRIAEIREAQHRFHAHVAELLERSRSSPDAPLELDRAWLASFAATFPPILEPCGSLGHYLQLLWDGSAARGMVWNSASVGFGKPYSRFLGGDGDGVARARERLRAAWASWAAASAPTDLNAVLGVNINLHPPLLPIELEYPGAKHDPGGGQRVIHLRDLRVRRREHAWDLELFDATQGTPITLLPMGFLFPPLSPPFYRFLCTFSPMRGIQLSYWTLFELWERRPTNNAVRRYPQMRLGGVVLDRATWKVPPSEMPRFAPGPEIEVTRAVREWREALGLPWQVFVQRRAITNGMYGLNVGIQDMAAHIQDAEVTSRRKPFYIDLRSHFGCVALEHALKDAKDTVTVRECLPATADVATMLGGRCSELVVELNTTGRPEGGE